MNIDDSARVSLVNNSPAACSLRSDNVAAHSARLCTRGERQTPSRLSELAAQEDKRRPGLSQPQLTAAKRQCASQVNRGVRTGKMAVLTRLVLVAVLVTSGRVQGTQLLLSPDTLVGEDNMTLTIQCRAQAQATENVTEVKIFKDTLLVAVVNSTGVNIISSAIRGRAAVNGSLTPPAAAFLGITFNRTATCLDKGAYVCERSSQQQGTTRDNKNLTARSDPRDFGMTVSPRMVTFPLNTEVELTCSGSVGNPVVGNWTWQTKTATSGSTWVPLGLKWTDTSPLPRGDCQMGGSSRLKFLVKEKDDNLAYRCYFRDPTYSATFTLQVNGCAGSEAKGQTMATGLVVWTLVTFLLTLGGQGPFQPSSTSKVLPTL